MKGVDRPLTQLIKAMSQFVIPVFQRDYSWRANEHCAQLWSDVLRVANSRTQRSHFLGAIVGIPDEDHAIGFNRCQVVDGQQRLTTATLLLVALRDHVKEAQDESIELTAGQIDSTYLRDTSRRGEQRYRLLLRRHDRDSLCALMDGRSGPDAPSANINAAYKFFRDRLKTVDPVSVWRGIHQLVIVEVTLNDESDNPQEIFESLNTTGLTLSKSDLIRNYILMGLQPERQTQLYEDYWRKIEDCFRGSEQVFDDFARDYVDVRTGRMTQTRSDRIYAAFKDYWLDAVPKKGVEQLLKEMMRLARYYADFRFGHETLPSRRSRYERIGQISSVPAIAVMRLRECRELLGESSESAFLESLDLIESFLVRGAICGWTPNAYNKVFAALAAGMSDSTPFNDFKGSLGLHREGYVFPTDAEFLRALRENNLYRRRKLCKFVLDRLEHHQNRHRTDTSKYTIEHILPQNPKLSKDWTDCLGEEWQQIQETWIHRLGNLTLTAYNSKYSDRSFRDKKTMERGFLESALKINTFVNRQDTWTAREIEARTEELATEALVIWPPLEDRELVEQARLRDKRKQAETRTVGGISMTRPIRESFGKLRSLVLTCGTDIVEVPESKSISYWRSRYFLEVVPQRNRLRLLFALDLEKIENPPDGVKDLREWTFVAGSRYRRDSGTIYSVTDDKDTMETALRLIRQAYDAAG